VHQYQYQQQRGILKGLVKEQQAAYMILIHAAEMAGRLNGRHWSGYAIGIV